MKVKLIRHSNMDKFCEELNDFLETLTGMDVDIKFSTSVGKSTTIIYSALVVYSYT